MAVMGRAGIVALAASLGLAVAVSEVCGQTPPPRSSPSTPAAPPADDVLAPLTPPAAQADDDVLAPLTPTAGTTDDDVLAPLTPPAAATDDDVLAPLTPPAAATDDDVLAPLVPTDAEVEAAVARRQREVMRRMRDQAEARNADGLRRGLDERGANEVVVNAPEDVAEARRIDLEREAAEARQAEADQRTAAGLDRDREAAAAAAALEEQRSDLERLRRMDEAIEAALSDDAQVAAPQSQANSAGNGADGAYQAWRRGLMQGSAEQVRLGQCMSTVSETKRQAIAGILSSYEQIMQAVGTAPQFVAIQLKIRDDSIAGVLAGDCGT